MHCFTPPFRIYESRPFVSLPVVAKKVRDQFFHRLSPGHMQFIMSFSSRSIVVALCLIQGFVAGSPLPMTGQCVDDNVLLSFRQGDASSLCKDVVMANQTTVTQQEVNSSIMRRNQRLI